MLCMVLKENPIVRYGKLQTVGEEVARMTQERIDEMVKASPNGVVI